MAKITMATAPMMAAPAADPGDEHIRRRRPDDRADDLAGEDRADGGGETGRRRRGHRHGGAEVAAEAIARAWAANCGLVVSNPFSAAASPHFVNWS